MFELWYCFRFMSCIPTISWPSGASVFDYKWKVCESSLSPQFRICVPRYPTISWPSGVTIFDNKGKVCGTSLLPLFSICMQQVNYMSDNVIAIRGYNLWLQMDHSKIQNTRLRLKFNWIYNSEHHSSSKITRYQLPFCWRFHRLPSILVFALKVISYFRSSTWMCSWKDNAFLFILAAFSGFSINGFHRFHTCWSW